MTDETPNPTAPEPPDPTPDPTPGATRGAATRPGGRPPSSADVRAHRPEYRGAELDPERGPGLGCFWFQLIVLVTFILLIPLGLKLGWPFEVLAVLLFIVIGLLLLTGQTVIFLLRLVAADRRAEGRRRPLASASKTVGELEDEHRVAYAVGATRPAPAASAAGEPSGATPDEAAADSSSAASRADAAQPVVDAASMIPASTEPGSPEEPPAAAAPEALGDTGGEIEGLNPDVTEDAAVEPGTGPSETTGEPRPDVLEHESSTASRRGGRDEGSGRGTDAAASADATTPAEAVSPAGAAAPASADAALLSDTPAEGSGSEAAPEARTPAEAAPEATAPEPPAEAPGDEAPQEPDPGVRQ